MANSYAVHIFASQFLASVLLNSSIQPCSSPADKTRTHTCTWSYLNTNGNVAFSRLAGAQKPLSIVEHLLPSQPAAPTHAVTALLCLFFSRISTLGLSQSERAFHQHCWPVLCAFLVISIGNTNGLEIRLQGLPKVSRNWGSCVIDRFKM